jgi:AAA domain-containing protein
MTQAAGASARAKREQVQTALASLGIEYRQVEPGAWAADCPVCGGELRFRELGPDCTLRCSGACAGSDGPALAALGLDRHWDNPPPAPITEPQPREKFRVLDLDAMLAGPPEPVPWAIAGLASVGDVTLLTGREGAGKSMLMLALCSGLGDGQSLAGISTVAGSALYVDAENGDREIARRLHGLGAPSEGLTMVSAEGVDLRNPPDLAALENLIAALRPSLVVLDSLTALCPGMKQNEAEAVAPLMYRLKALADRQCVAIVVLHHVPKTGGEYRGSTAMAAAVQSGFVLERADEDPDRSRRRLRCWKCRPAPEPATVWLSLSAEQQVVVISPAQPFEAPDAPPAPTPAQERLIPRVRAALSDQGQSQGAIARSLGRDSKDRTVRVVLNRLRDDGEAANGADGWRTVSRAKLAGGARHLDTLASNRVLEPEARGVETDDTPSSLVDPPERVATLEEQFEYERVRSKFPDPVASP